MIDNDILQDYIEKFNEYYEFTDDGIVNNYHILSLKKEFLEKQLNVIGNTITDMKDENAHDYRCGTAVFYGYRINSEFVDGKSQLIEREIGYEATPLWKFSLDDLLNTEADSIEETINNFMEWMINPGQTVNLAEDIFELILCKSFNLVYKYVDCGGRFKYSIIVPFFSKDIKMPNIDQLVGKINANIDFTVSNYSAFISPKKNEREYLVIVNDETDLSNVIIASYELYRNEKILTGALGFIEGDSIFYEMQEIPNQTFQLYKKEIIKEDVKKIEIIPDILIESNLPELTGYKAFLSQHSTGFYDMQYVCNGKVNFLDNEGLFNFIKKGLKLTPAQLCVKQNDNQYINNISLNDVIYVSNIMEKERIFKKSEIKNRKKAFIESNKALEDAARKYEINLNIPCNFDAIQWKLDGFKSQIDFDEITYENTLEEKIISIIDYYKSPTTSTIAEELLFLENDRTDTIPSSYMIYNVFNILLHTKNIIMNKKIEIRDYPDEKDLAIQSTKAFSGNIGRKVNNRVVNRVFSNEISIRDVHFTVRTFNCLNRAKYTTLNQLRNMTDDELLRIRNLGIRGVREIRTKLKEYGLGQQKY